MNEYKLEEHKGEDTSGIISFKTFEGNRLGYCLTLSWRMPLSYRNQSIDFYMITASVMKDLMEKNTKDFL